jgi:hypothetical protein
VVVVVVVVLFPADYYYSFLFGFYRHFYLHGIDHSLLSIATSMESTVAVFAASKSIFP